MILSDLEITNALAAAQVRVKNQIKTPDSAKFDLTTATMTKTWENGEMVYNVALVATRKAAAIRRTRNAAAFLFYFNVTQNGNKNAA